MVPLLSLMVNKLKISYCIFKNLLFLGGFKGILNVVGFKTGGSSGSAAGTMVTSLLNSGANPNIVDKTGSTALIYGNDNENENYFI
jgi:hypothetical protein